MAFDVVWAGGKSLTDALERDYAACRGEGWELIYVPPSPLTTPWEDYGHLAKELDVNRHIKSPVVRRIRARADELAPIEYHGIIAQRGSHQ